MSRTAAELAMKPNGGGTIINVTLSPHHGLAGMTHSSAARAAVEGYMRALAREWAADGRLADRTAWAAECRDRRTALQRKTHFESTPIKPQRVYEEMNRAFGPETRYVSTIGLSQIQAAQMLHVYRPRHWINRRNKQ